MPNRRRIGIVSGWKIHQNLISGKEGGGGDEINGGLENYPKFKILSSIQNEYMS